MAVGRNILKNAGNGKRIFVIDKKGLADRFCSYAVSSVSTILNGVLNAELVLPFKRGKVIHRTQMGL